MQTSFSYAVIRVVPRVEREEFLNCGVIVFSLEAKFLAARIDDDRERLRVLWPQIEGEEVERQLEAILLICRGDREGGPIAKLPVRERFHWLVAPRSTVVQVSAVHTGISKDLQKTVEHLYKISVA